MQCDLGGLTVFYESYGTGRPIVMLPGRPSDHHIMERFMEPLFAQRDGWQRIYPDLPGTGLTSCQGLLPTHDQMLDTMLAFIDKVIPGQRFVLVGLSYGGYMARGVLSRRAELIDGLMLCAPQVKADLTRTPLPPRTTVVENPALVARLDPNAAQLVKILVVAQTPTVIETLPTLLAEVQRSDETFNDLLETAPAASFEAHPQTTPFVRPTLIVTARQDHICGYRDAWELLDNYPRATFAVLDQAGHLINSEQDKLCRSLMHEWLDRVEAYPAS